MPVFGREEYEFGNRPSLEEAYARLPVLARWDGLRVRWIGPLVDLGFDGWIEEVGQGAWVVAPNWADAFDACGPLCGPSGRPRRAWTKVFGEVVRDLARMGGDAGFEGDPERVASIIAFTLAESHDLLRRRAVQRGANE